MKNDIHLVPIKPFHLPEAACPECGSAGLQFHRSVFPGVHIFADLTCNSCGTAFLREYPVGFAVQHPVAIGKKDGKLFNIGDAPGWFTYYLMKAYNAHAERPPEIERIVHDRKERVVILDCLDFLYGHVLLKLLNARYYLDEHPDLGLVLILPKMFAWLVPKGTAEVWLVDMKLGQAHNWYEGIDLFVNERLKEYDEAYLARGYAHPDQSKIDMGRFTGIAPFDPLEFDQQPKHITFVARQDRLWTGESFTDLLFRGMVRFKLQPLLKGILIGMQNARIKRTMRSIKRVLPEVGFTIVGLDDPGGFEDLATDLRTRSMNVEKELEWCRAYAKSQIVVGVHGSNMLLPTAFAAGAVEILPDDRLGNMVQDIFVRYTDRMQLFMYRFVREHATPQEVADHCTAMFRDHAAYRRNMCQYTV